MKLTDVGISSNEVKEIINKYMIDTYERYDFIAETASDMYLYDENNEAYLDFYSGIAVNNAGNCNKNVVKAIKEQADDIIHTFNYPYTIPQTVLAKLICETLNMERILFLNSGAEANEAMIKMARKYGVDKYNENKYHIVTAKKSFHGRSYAALSATGQPDTGCHIGFKPILEGFSYADFNDIESFKNACNENTIAIMLEPIQGEGGVYPATYEFMQEIRKFCDEKGILLLLDEIQTGWCRTGEIMGYMHYDIKPDIISMAKGMGGGMPISAVCTSLEISKVFSMGTHGSTYGGNPVCCAASYAQINELIDKKLGENAIEMGNYFMSLLVKLPHVSQIRGKGLLLCMELDGNYAVDVKHKAIDNKLLVTSIGNTIIRFTPPLTLTKEECDKAFAILNNILKCYV